MLLQDQVLFKFLRQNFLFSFKGSKTAVSLSRLNADCKALEAAETLKHGDMGWVAIVKPSAFLYSYSPGNISR